MNIPEFNEIVEPNDQTEARQAHLAKLRELIGNVYPNKYDRSKITGAEDTISNVVNFQPIIEIVNELKDNTPAGEKPNQELKAQLNERLKAFGNVRISGRLAVPPRVMGKAAFVHLSDGVERLQIYCRKADFTVDAATRGDADAATRGDGDAENETESVAVAASARRRVAVSPEESWAVFGLLDHGDFIGAEGFLFLTNTGELSVHVETLQFLAKSLMPMPDKMHDIADPEISRRYRYVDLIASSLRNKTDDELEEETRTGVKKLTTREVFERRAKLISGMRRFLDDHDYIEVETPMLTPKATGAAAKPFQTHHNALDITLYARIAPELYLKRLTVGGFERVYELNRNFRNEGLSNKHNPEFTMLEFYCAYMDVNGMMDFAEAMIKESVQKATGGSLQVKYGENEIDFSKFERLTMKEAIVRYGEFSTLDEISIETLPTLRRLNALLVLTTYRRMNASVEYASLKSPKEVLEKVDEQKTRFLIRMKKPLWEIAEIFSESNPDKKKANENGIDEDEFSFVVNNIISEINDENKKSYIIEKIFEDYAEEHLGKIAQETSKKIIKPTFITDYPKSISPLSKASPENPNIAERFELFINGMECANGFSELNDPQEQYERFADQMKERETGDEEAMVLDEDYIRALSYGMPPAAGIGIGIDRLVMLLTNKHSIRDVILFPHLRPERKDVETENSRETEEKT